MLTDNLRDYKFADLDKVDGSEYLLLGIQFILVYITKFMNKYLVLTLLSPLLAGLLCPCRIATDRQPLSLELGILWKGRHSGIGDFLQEHWHSAALDDGLFCCHIALSREHSHDFLCAHCLLFLRFFVHGLCQRTPQTDCEGKREVTGSILWPPIHWVVFTDACFHSQFWVCPGAWCCFGSNFGRCCRHNRRSQNAFTSHKSLCHTRRSRGC